MTLLTPQAPDGTFCAVVIFLGQRYQVTRNATDAPFFKVEEAEEAAKRLARGVLCEVFERQLGHMKWGDEDEA